MKVGSKEFNDLMEKWSREAYQEEMGNAKEEWYANEDMHGRLTKRTETMDELFPIDD